MADFWQMVVEAQSTLIVMVTPVVERGRIKCHKYWPAYNQTLELGHLHITCIREETETTGSFVFREFRLTNLEVKVKKNNLRSIKLLVIINVMNKKCSA